MNGNHILFVDDDDIILQLLSIRFRGRGFRCSTANSGSEALDILARQRVHVLVTDLQMPGMDGIELLHQIHERGIITRSVVVTGYASLANLTACLREGAVALVPKPLGDLTELDRAVDQAMSVVSAWMRQMDAIIQLRQPRTGLEGTGQT